MTMLEVAVLIVISPVLLGIGVACVVCAFAFLKVALEDAERKRRER